MLVGRNSFPVKINCVALQSARSRMLSFGFTIIILFSSLKKFKSPTTLACEKTEPNLASHAVCTYVRARPCCDVSYLMATPPCVRVRTYIRIANGHVCGKGLVLGRIVHDTSL